MLGYDQDYFSWQKQIGTFGGKMNLFKFSPFITAQDYVLDFGCGGGYLLKCISCAGKLGIKINPVSRVQAKELGIDVVASIEEVPDSFASVVISNHALEHVECPVEVLRTLRRKMRSAAKAVFVVPHETISKPFREDDINQHLYTWTPLTLGNLFRTAGYSRIRVDIIRHTWPPYYRALHGFLGEKIFHVLCNVYARLSRTYQLRVVAEPTSDDRIASY